MAKQGSWNTMTQDDDADQDQSAYMGPDAVVTDTYERLRRIAHQHLRRYRPGETFNTTAVVHEAYIKLAGEAGVLQRPMRSVERDWARARAYLFDALAR